jgi:hypothetical protein
MVKSLICNSDYRALLEECTSKSNASGSTTDYLPCPRFSCVAWLYTGDMALDESAFWWSTASLGETVADAKFIFHSKGGNDNCVLGWEAIPRNERRVC